MKSTIAWVGVFVIVAAFPAFAHNTDHNDEVKAWADRYFDEVDTDGNGYITKEEFLDHAEQKFDAMDTNHDGKLSKREVIHYKLQEQAEWRRQHGQPVGGRDKPDETRGDNDRPDANDNDKTNSGNTSSN